MKYNKLIPALLFLLLLTACGQEASGFDPSDYEHPGYASTIEKEDCYLCGERADHSLTTYWGQDNVGLLDVNTFEVFQVPINTYGLDGRQIKEAQRVLLVGGASLGELRIVAYTDPDRGHSRVNIPSGGTIDPEAIGTFLCQDCLDAFAENIFVRDTPSEIAVLNFATRELRPLVETYIGFGLDNYSVNCDFKEDGDINLLIYYAPLRFQETD